MYKGIYKRMLKRTDKPENRIPLRFSYQLCLWIYITFYIIYKLLTKNNPYYLDINPNISILIGFTSFLILGGIFATILNFEWIKKIELTKKQKNKSRIILFLTIIIVSLLLKL